MNIKREYIDILHKIEQVCIEFDTTKSTNLLKIVKMTNLKDIFNCVDFWDNFKPNVDKPYSILNNEASFEGNGVHWVGVFQDGNKLYIYDSFGRKHIMDRFCNEMEKQGYKCRYINKKTDQQTNQMDCGLRSLLWLLFVHRYGIKQASKI